MLLPKNRQPTHPGEMLLQEFIIPLGITQKQLALHLGWTTAKLNEIIHGKRGVSAASALALADAFSMEAEFWLNLQFAFDLWQASRHHVKRKKLAA